MVSYLIRRLLLVIPTLIGMTMLVFFVMARVLGLRTSRAVCMSGLYGWRRTS